MSDISLLDTPEQLTAQWHVVYMKGERQSWVIKNLKPGFQHVMLWRPIRYGPLISDTMWLVIDPTWSMVTANVTFDKPPWQHDAALTVQRVSTIRPQWSLRSKFHVGPFTCVEVAKACLGIRAWWLHTPWQLYQYIAARNCVLR